MEQVGIMGKMEMQYLGVLRRLVDEGERREDRTGVGTFGVFGHQMRCDLGEEFPLLTTKKMPMKTISDELRWFLQGRTDVAFLQERKCTIWDEWATAEQCARFGRKEGDLGPVYGKQWRHFGGTPKVALVDQDVEERKVGKWVGGFDQLAWLVAEIRKNPNSRRLILSAWDPADAQVVALPPCHTLFQCQVQNGRLSLHNYMRSCDIFLGLPFNIASYALLVKLLSAATGTVSGDLVFSFGDLHLYRNHVDQAREQLSRAPKAPPSVAVEHDAGLEGIPLLESEWKVRINGYDPHPPIRAQVAV